MKTAIIVEDELLAQKRLKRLIDSLGLAINVLCYFETIEDTASYLKEVEIQPDIIFLDIQLADGNSFELFNLVTITSNIIMTTAYNEYAVEAFRHRTVDYLLKPIKKEQLKDAVSRIELSYKTKENIESPTYKNRFLIRFGQKYYSILTKDIAYIFAKNKIVYFYSFDGNRIPSDYKLQVLEEQLNPKQFFRANRQFIVNIEAIGQLQRHGHARLKIGLNPPIEENIIISTEKSRVMKTWMNK